jgi:hypothetical protein
MLHSGMNMVTQYSTELHSRIYVKRNSMSGVGTRFLVAVIDVDSVEPLRRVTRYIRMYAVKNRSRPAVVYALRFGSIRRVQTSWYDFRRLRDGK